MFFFCFFFFAYIPGEDFLNHPSILFWVPKIFPWLFSHQLGRQDPAIMITTEPLSLHVLCPTGQQRLELSGHSAVNSVRRIVGIVFRERFWQIFVAVIAVTCWNHWISRRNLFLPTPGNNHPRPHFWARTFREIQTSQLVPSGVAGNTFTSPSVSMDSLFGSNEVVSAGRWEMRDLSSQGDWTIFVGTYYQIIIIGYCKPLIADIWHVWIIVNKLTKKTCGRTTSHQVVHSDIWHTKWCMKNFGGVSDPVGQPRLKDLLQFWWHLGDQRTGDWTVWWGFEAPKYTRPMMLETLLSLFWGGSLVVKDSNLMWQWDRHIHESWGWHSKDVEDVGASIFTRLYNGIEIWNLTCIYLKDSCITHHLVLSTFLPSCFSMCWANLTIHEQLEKLAAGWWRRGPSEMYLGFLLDFVPENLAFQST